MREHWRLGVVERAVLETLDAMGAQPDRPHTKCIRVLERLAGDHGVGARYGYDALCMLGQKWRLHAPLVDPHGNFGSPDDGPANPRYTEARLSRAGALALAADRGAGPKLPFALINGDLHVDGTAPPFSPRRVIDTLLALIDDPGLTDEELVERVGPPESPTGCRMATDNRLLASGAAGTLVLTARLTIEQGQRGPLLVLAHLALGVGGTAVAEALAARVDAGAHRRDRGIEPGEFDQLMLALRDIRDESHADVVRIVCELKPDAVVDAVAQQIASTWGVTTRRAVQLPAPLATLMRELVDADIEAQRRVLDELSGLLGA